MIEQLNRNAFNRILSLKDRADKLDISIDDRHVCDFGVNVQGSLEAGLDLARICFGGAGEVKLLPGVGDLPSLVQFQSDQPGLACMGSQYGGWQVKHDDYFAIGSGPIRLCRGKEKVLEEYGWRHADSDCGVLVLEAGKLPDESVIDYVCQESGLSLDQIAICVAPAKSVAGSLQIVARVVESTMHKLFELGFDLRKVTSASGTAPLPPVAYNDLTAIGRTNDAILYAGHVTINVDLSDDEIEQLGPGVPSNSSDDHGQSFEQLFKACGGDFYKMDPMLFSAAKVQFVSDHTGNSFEFGEAREAMVYKDWGVGQ